MTPSEYLAALPPPMQGELVDLVKAAARMSQDDRTRAVATFIGVSQAFLEAGLQTHVSTISFLDHVGRVMRALDHIESPRTTTSATTNPTDRR